MAHDEFLPSGELGALFGICPSVTRAPAVANTAEHSRSHHLVERSSQGRARQRRRVTDFSPGRTAGRLLPVPPAPPSATPALIGYRLQRPEGVGERRPLGAAANGPTNEPFVELLYLEGARPGRDPMSRPAPLNLKKTCRYRVGATTAIARLPHGLFVSRARTLGA